MKTLYGGIEAGGTKFVCAVGSGPGEIEAIERFPTTTPEETLRRTIDFFRHQQDAGHHFEAIGIASFGPVDPRPDSETFGYITATPKPNWSHTNFVGPISDAFGMPVAFDIDVNVAALGEHTWGSAIGLDTFIYMTIGTGIGGGGMINGELMHGLIHPEVGHIRIPHDLERDPFPGRCPYHGDCLEGLACGPAIEDRWKKKGFELPPDHPAWDLEAEYLAYAALNYICTVSPQKIIMGGGVMEQPKMHELIRKHVKRLLNDYIQSPTLIDGLDDFIVPPGLGNESGVLGAFALAKHLHG
ncbi:ROK family protein [Rubinisphaera italica]|uniref:fructokinase n=1 Tax=Rubinisphaera italica TaxID=2527969 RepID=A0A5C5XAJ5_9PLAN|nr:ROK family protein [Rubinisphaera italica]TWT59411.1 putative fructokinase [Rubinisphaera italica]